MPLTALILLFIFIFEIGTRAARVAEDLLQRQSTVQRLAAVVTTASDAETGQRGYLLTGDEKYLAPYTNALSAMPVRIAALRKAAAESLVSANDVDKIDQLVSAKFSELAETVNLKRQHRDPEALARRMQAFCPDVTCQVFYSLEELVQHLREERSFHLWWD